MPRRTSTVKTITILGSTGSVGLNALNVIRASAGRFQVKGLAAGSNHAALGDQIEEWRPKAVYLRDASAAGMITQRFGRRTKVFTEKEGLEAFSSYVDADILLAATSGTAALPAVLDALKKGRRVALANKEVLVVAGDLVMKELAMNTRAELVPVDSEHSAIFQCLAGNRKEDVERLILTGSGGPLRRVDPRKFDSLDKDTVTRHPKWKMGKKISVDSATLMNKGLELIEASALFSVPVEKIDVLIHPEAIVHSMVEYKDGSVMAQLGVTDMRLPILYAFACPVRPAYPEMRLDWKSVSRLTFEPPDRRKFPCLDIAYQAARRSGSAPCVLSAADEVAVGAFLEDRIVFPDIPRVIEKVLSRHRHVPKPRLSEILSIHDWAVAETRKVCSLI